MSKNEFFEYEKKPLFFFLKTQKKRTFVKVFLWEKGHKQFLQGKNK